MWVGVSVVVYGSTHLTTFLHENVRESALGGYCKTDWAKIKSVSCALWF